MGVKIWPEQVKVRSQLDCLSGRFSLLTSLPGSVVIDLETSTTVGCGFKSRRRVFSWYTSSLTALKVDNRYRAESA